MCDVVLNFTTSALALQFYVPWFAITLRCFATRYKHGFRKLNTDEYVFPLCAIVCFVCFLFHFFNPFLRSKFLYSLSPFHYSLYSYDIYFSFLPSIFSSFVLIFSLVSTCIWPPLWSSGQSSWLLTQRSEFDSRCYQIL
jgi:hypothetical protein